MEKNVFVWNCIGYFLSINIFGFSIALYFSTNEITATSIIIFTQLIAVLMLVKGLRNI